MHYFFTHFFLPAGFLVASIIGAGMFALPFVFQQSGLIPGILYLVFFGMIAALIHLLYADIILRTRETRHQFPGYIKQYLGNRVGSFSEVLVFVTLLFTLVAYLVLAISFLHILAPALSPLAALLVFWALATATIFINVKNMAWFNAMTTVITLVAIGAIFVYWRTYIPFDPDAFPILNANELSTPFGPVLFSFLGFSAIPPLVAYARKESIPFPSIKKAIIIGSLIPAFFYLLYVLSVWGMSSAVSPDSVSGLMDVAPFSILLVIGVLGFVSLWDSYSAIGRDVDKLLTYEWGISTSVSFITVSALPLLLYAIGFQNFLTIVSAVGGVFFCIWGLLIVLAWKKAIRVGVSSIKFSAIDPTKHTSSLPLSISPFVIGILLITFVGGMIYSIVDILAL